MPWGCNLTLQLFSLICWFWADVILAHLKTLYSQERSWLLITLQLKRSIILRWHLKVGRHKMQTLHFPVWKNWTTHTGKERCREQLPDNTRQNQQRLFFLLFKLWDSSPEFLHGSGEVRFLCSCFRGTPRNRKHFFFFPSHTECSQNSHY